ncbi:putative E3 ubiquitin-protein ligase UBR7 [Cimex lectularius]|uniref:UBR-type domain-containing protein n=1 Tax=Cimex lectularius TaxID=79782 RepID=A0A8I6TL22_CIMLE|nr:putative E3 ubiquitin-protein ligase UBR7 [Cimex lectularius]
MSEEKEEETLTLVDFLEEENEIELTVQDVLGPSDDKNCTYNLGYMGRQALYACLTCNSPESPDFKYAGICLACSYHCHEGHNLIELYTKRFFRCDCGNSKFGGKKCNLTPEKDDVNDNNNYNQNFKGLYCTCSRPYPDPEAEDDSDVMLQCIVCEDWYHSSHLNNETPPDCQDSSFSELICEGCTEKLPFLNYYLDKSVNTKFEGKDVSSNEETKGDVPNVAKEETKVDVEDTSLEKNKDCYRKTHPLLRKISKGATLWPSTFRSILCSCSECLEEYKKYKVPWIADEQDTAHAYQEKGKTEGENSGENSSYAQGMKALQKLDRFRQVEAIHNYNDLKSQLHTYLADFVQRKRVVKEEDIHAFFDYMQQRKKRRIGTPPYMC